jgi:release factor glutamine methyltransferase
MITIQTFLDKYSKKIDYLDLELIIAQVLGKNLPAGRQGREFILSHPEYKLVKSEKLKVKSYLLRRIKHEPLAYILGEKEFYGMKFIVNRNVLIPRPETEMIIDLVLQNIKNKIGNDKIIIADIGTGSGNIIISLAHSIKRKTWSKFKFYGTDISKGALKVAKQNAKVHKLDKKINFLNGNIFEPFLKSKKLDSLKTENCKLIIVGNLPYLSPKIYASCSLDIKKFEPKKALISRKEGLAHYEKLFEQIKSSRLSNIVCFVEISPEQKMKIAKMVKKYFSEAEINFHKDLSGRWRICELKIKN